MTRGEVPAHARSAFGDRLAALASLLVGKYRLSKRLVKDALSDMLGVELSVGSVSNLEGEISEALAPATAEALAYVEKRMRGVERGVGQLLREAARRAEKKTAGMAREILQWEMCLSTFVDVPGLEPTHNFGERCIRHAVMYRKTSFGTQSEEGSRFVERIFTATSRARGLELHQPAHTRALHRIGSPQRGDCSGASPARRNGYPECHGIPANFPYFRLVLICSVYTRTIERLPCATSRCGLFYWETMEGEKHEPYVEEVECPVDMRGGGRV